MFRTYFRTIHRISGAVATSKRGARKAHQRARSMSLSRTPSMASSTTSSSSTSSTGSFSSRHRATSSVATAADIQLALASGPERRARESMSFSRL